MNHSDESKQRATDAPRLVQIIATWVVICPEVIVVNALLSPISSTWNPYLRSAVETAIVIPPAVLWAVPAVLALFGRIQEAHQRPRQSRNSAGR